MSWKERTASYGFICLIVIWCDPTCFGRSHIVQEDPNCFYSAWTKIAFLGLCILKELVLKFLHPVFKSLIEKNKWMAIKHLKSVNTMPGLPFWLLCEPVWNHRGGGTAGGRAGGSCIPPLETELRIQHPDCHYKPIRYKRCRDRSGTTLHGLGEYPVTVHWTLNLYWVKPLHRAHLVVSDSSPDLNVTAFVGGYMWWVSGISPTSDYG